MELKPCPFCGGESEGVSDKGVVYGRIIHKRECPLCEMIGAMPQRKWKAWNHRPTEDALRAEQDALRRKMEKLKRAYALARNSAAGLTNYCEESASTRRCEKELEKAESIFADLEGGKP